MVTGNKVTENLFKYHKQSKKTKYFALVIGNNTCLYSILFVSNGTLK